MINKCENIALTIRNELVKKYGNDLAGKCIEASELIAQRISSELGVEAVTVEGWCQFDNESYGSDRPWDPHTWVEVPSLGLYIDATADQFNFGMWDENEFDEIIVQKGLPFGMRYDEPSWSEYENSGFDENYIPEDKIMIAVLDEGYYLEHNEYPAEYSSEYASEVYTFDTPEEFIEKWYELEEGAWYWVFADGDVICSGAVDPNDYEIFEDYFDMSFEEIFSRLDMQDEIKDLNIRAIQSATDEYFDNFDFFTHVSRSPMVFSAKRPNNLDRDVDEQFAAFFNKNLTVKSCDYGCDTYPNGVSKSVQDGNVQTYQQSVWNFIEEVEQLFNCKCNYYDEVNGFEFVFEFGEDKNKACYVFGAGNNGQEFSQVLYFNDLEQITDDSFVNTLTTIDSVFYTLLEKHDLKREDRVVFTSLGSQIETAASRVEEAPSPAQHKTKQIPEI